jgi:type VI protein secretion system component VasK
MNPQVRAALRWLILVAVLVLLALLFKPVLAFVEMAALELRYFWWLILLVALAVWLIWGVGRKPKD